LYGLSVVSNQFKFSVPSQSGRVYAIQHAASLSRVDWTTSPLVAGNGSNLIFAEPITSTQQFYRVLRW
jgi:hypothetical protein